MARGSIGRERIVSGVLGIDMPNHQMPATNHQEHVLNDELLAVIWKIFLTNSLNFLHSIRRSPILLTMDVNMNYVEKIKYS